MSADKKSTKKNYVFNLIYQLFALITPLITTPYISRVLGSSGVGQYSFTYSISTYFVLLGSIGFGYYAQREIAKAQNDKYVQSKIFFEIMLAKAICVAFSLILYFGIILTGVYGETYTTLMIILSINVFSILFDVTFLFQGNEEFGLIALRNILIKVVGVVVIMVLVKNESHVWLYALSLALITVVSNLSLWTRLPKMILKVNLRELDIKKHFLPSLRLFIPTLAVSVYTVLDKTLIGVIVPGTTIVNGVEKNVSDVENGFYEQAEKMVKMAMTVITSLGTIMIPRNSNAIAKGDSTEFMKNIYGAVRFVFFLGTPIMFGLMAVAFNFSPWFFGDGYEKVPYLIVIMCPLILIIGLSNVFGLQYLIPLQKDLKYTIAIICGATINLVLNVLLIHFYWSYGAAIATIAAEIAVTIIMYFFVRKDVSFISAIGMSWKYILSGGIMFGTIFLTQHFLSPSITHTLILIFEGIVLYFSLLLVLRDRWFISQIKSIASKIFSKKQ